MKRSTRILFAAASLSLALVYVLPLWHISLDAPQYPEGLGLYIGVSRISGEKPQDLNSINNLNHYIGMKVITPEDIPELRYMPWLVAGLIVTGVVAAASGKRALLAGWVALFGAGALAGLADFYRWGYDYGHNLDPEAIIKIPGMSYQPPVLGGKQLLNFHATSWPAAGGWVAIVALTVGVVLVIREWRSARHLPVAAVLAAACSPSGPRAIALNEEACAHCHMTIADPRFGAELITGTGRVLTFDDVGCMAAWLSENPTPLTGAWVMNYVDHAWMAADSAIYLQTDSLRTPMASGLAALRPGPESDSVRARLGGELVSWAAVRSHPHTHQAVRAAS
jgi:copper chaperone NosL